MRDERTKTRFMIFGGCAILILALTVWFNGPTGAVKMYAQVMSQKNELRPFELVDANGQNFNATDLIGKWTVLTFGYTSCPDVCPMAMAYFRDEMKDLPEKEVQFIFISVDPGRDTPEKLKTYATFFDPRIRMLTGSEDELLRLAQNLHAYFDVPEAKRDNYGVAHSPQYYLIGPKGTWEAFYSPPLPKGALAEDLKKLLGAEKETI